MKERTKGNLIFYGSLVIISGLILLGTFAIVDMRPSEPVPRIRDAPTEYVRYGEVTSVEVEGHIYLYRHRYDAGGLIHAEHCPCHEGR